MTDDAPVTGRGLYYEDIPDVLDDYESRGFWLTVLCDPEARQALIPLIPEAVDPAWHGIIIRDRRNAEQRAERAEARAGRYREALWQITRGYGTAASVTEHVAKRMDAIAREALAAQEGEQ